MPDRPWTDEFTLLCEKCGYVIEGLDPDSACPECGKAIVESLPERRVGTAWQRNGTLWSLICSAMSTLRQPGITLDSMEIGHSRDAQLWWLYAVLSTAGLLTPCVAAGMTFFADIPADEWLGVFFVSALVLLAVLSVACFLSILILRVLTWTESRGLMLFGSRRGFRITPAAARSITAHGSIGWVIACVGGGLFSGAAVLAFGPFTNQATGTVFSLAAVIFALAGFLFFEVFAWLGLRRCRFANRKKPTDNEPET